MANTLEKISLVKDRGIREKLERAFRFSEKLVEGKTVEQKQLEKLLTSSPAKPVQIACENRLKEIGSATNVSDADIVNGVKGMGLSLAYIVRLGLGKYVNQTQYSETHKKPANEAPPERPVAAPGK